MEKGAGGNAGPFLREETPQCREFAAGRDEFCACIALVEDGFPVLGVLAEAARGLVHAHTATAKLEEINDVFHKMEKGQIDGRIVLDFA